MNYEDFQGYVQHMKDAHDPEIKIHWPVIDIPGIDARDHGERFGLQLSDLAVSGLTAALEPDFYGNVEPRFARSLKSRVYQRNGNYMSYGTKMYPGAAALELSEQQQEFVTIFSEV
jgi:hypothetical protein